MNRDKHMIRKVLAGALACIMAVSLAGCGVSPGGSSSSSGKAYTVKNVTFDGASEFFKEYNRDFAAYYKEEKGINVSITMSSGGSAAQADAVIKGENADVVTLARSYDVSRIKKHGLIDSGWMGSLDWDSSPFSTTIVLLVRKGNPKHIRDWDDAAKRKVRVIAADPRTSGSGCFGMIAAWEYASQNLKENQDACEKFMKKLYGKKNAVIAADSAEAEDTFLKQKKGDVLIAWESDALQTVEKYPDSYKIIYPSISALAKPTVAVVDRNADADSVSDVSEDYLKYLYSDEAQKLLAEYGFRPGNDKIMEKYSSKFHSKKTMLCSEEDLGGWSRINEQFLEEGALMDQILDE